MAAETVAQRSWAVQAVPRPLRPVRSFTAPAHTMTGDRGAGADCRTRPGRCVSCASGRQLEPREPLPKRPREKATVKSQDVVQQGSSSRLTCQLAISSAGGTSSRTASMATMVSGRK